MLLTQQQATPRLQWRRLFDVAPTAGAGALLSGPAMGAFWGLAPVYARTSGFDAAAIGNYMSIAIVGGAALQWPLGRLSDRHDRRIALALVSAAAALAAIASIAMGGRMLPEMAVVFLFGGMGFAIYPIVVAHLVDHAPPEDLLAASSSVLLVYGVGSAIGPLIAGGMMGALGAPSLFAWFAATHGVLAAYATFRYRQFRRIPADAPAFQPMLRTTPAALRLLRPAVRFQREGRAAMQPRVLTIPARTA